MAKKAPVSSRHAPRTLKSGGSYSLADYLETGAVKEALKHKWREPTAQELTETPLWTDEELEAAIQNRKAKVKRPVLVRLDPDVVAWLKSHGPGHTTRINSILRLAMEAEQRSR